MVPAVSAPFEIADDFAAVSRVNGRRLGRIPLTTGGAQRTNESLSPSVPPEQGEEARVFKIPRPRIGFSEKCAAKAREGAAAAKAGRRNVSG